MDLYYIREKVLPSDINECCRLIRAVTRPERQAVSRILSEFFENTAEGFNHKRCDAEIARMRDKQNKAKGSANARWNFTSQHTERNANAMRTHSEGNAPSNQKPVTSNQKPVTKKIKQTASPTAPPDVDSQVWLDFLALRKGKRAVVTNTALDGLRLEASKAHVSLEEALRIACQRGWMGFKAEWIEDRRNSNGKQAELEQRNAQAGKEWLRRHEPQPEIFDAVTSER